MTNFEQNDMLISASFFSPKVALILGWDFKTQTWILEAFTPDFSRFELTQLKWQNTDDFDARASTFAILEDLGIL